MSNQNRFLLPHTPATTTTTTTSATNSTAVTTTATSTTATTSNNLNDQENQHSVDTDFDSYWEEEARNPHRNRIRIGRQYQATVPPLLKPGDSDERKLSDLETLTFCPKRSAKVSNAELDHYFTVAKSLNLFASLVETRSLLGRDVTIADLNRIRNKEGLSLASVIQPSRQQVANYGYLPQSSQQQLSTTTSATTSNATSIAQKSASSPAKSPPTVQSSTQQQQDNKPSSSSASTSTTTATANAEAASQQPQINPEVIPINQPLMRALSHFISLHHPCHHDQNCKKLNRDLPLEDDSVPAVSITAGNLRQVSSSASSSPVKSGRSRSSRLSKQGEEIAENTSGQANNQLDQPGDNQNQANSDNTAQSELYDDWTREDVELFSKAIEVCGKNFGSIKKEFLPTKSVRSIVEYYYIGSRDVSDSKKKLNQTVEFGDNCNCADKSQTNLNNCGSGSGGNDGSAGGCAGGPSSAQNSGSKTNPSTTSSSRQTSSNTNTETNESRSSSKLNLSDIDKLAMSSTNNQRASNNCGAKTKLDLANHGNNNDQLRTSSKSKTNPKSIDARMSVYNFDDEFKDDSPIKLECPPRPGAEVRPLKAKPIIPNASLDNEAGNSNGGSLKFFMDGQLVLKLNACQDQQEGSAGDKYHWVQSGERLAAQNRQKRYSKRAFNDTRATSEQSLNGSHSNSVVSSNIDEDSKNEDLTLDEDSKESANSFSNATSAATATPSQKSTKSKQSTPKRSKSNESQATMAAAASAANSNQAPSPIDYNRLAINNRMKDNFSSQLPIPGANPLINQAAAAAAAAANMPNWFQANQFAMAAAILGGLPFPAAPGMMPNINAATTHNNINNNNGVSHLQQPASNIHNNNVAVNMATSKPMDLSLEHTPPKPITTKPSSRSRSKQKN